MHTQQTAPPAPPRPLHPQCLCVEPVSWLSRNVTAREGQMPLRPGGRPWGSDSLRGRTSVGIVVGINAQTMGQSVRNDYMRGNDNTRAHLQYSLRRTASWMMALVVMSKAEARPPVAWIQSIICFLRLYIYRGVPLSS